MRFTIGLLTAAWVIEIQVASISITTFSNRKWKNKSVSTEFVYPGLDWDSFL